jgi:DNA-binding FadR family transcriptional regulator
MNTPITTTPAADSGHGAQPAPGLPDLEQLLVRHATAQRGRGLHGQLVQQLGQMIAAGELGVDRPLVPEEIGHRFDVSRTVVRESLRVLEAKGLVSARPNVGTRIRPVHEWNLLDPDVIEWRALGPSRGEQRRELAELRQAVEPLAAQLATGQLTTEQVMRMTELVAVMREAVTLDRAAYVRADVEFHLLMLHASGNRMIEHLAGVVYGALDAAAMRAGACGEPTARHADEHDRLLGALTSTDGPATAARLRALLLVGVSDTGQIVPSQRGIDGEPAGYPSEEEPPSQGDARNEGRRGGSAQPRYPNPGAPEYRTDLRHHYR